MPYGIELSVGMWFAGHRSCVRRHLNVSRLRKLFQELKPQFPDDWYLDGIDLSLELFPQARSAVATYERVLRTLDDGAWGILKEKVIREFSTGKNDGRGKHQFYNHLNEAFAFRFLLQSGYQQVTLIPEDTAKKNKPKSPDIRFIRNNSFAYCEVKTINISENEIARMQSENSFNSSIYQQLDNPFLKTKFTGDIRHASEQISSLGTDGLVYIIAHFDDFTLAHYSTYRQQIMGVLNSEFPTQEVYIKIGLQSRKYIHHYPSRNQSA